MVPRGRSRSRRFVGSARLLGARLLAACAPAAPPVNKPADASAQAPTPGGAATPADHPVRGGTSGIGMHGDLVSFDVVTQTATLHLSVMGLVQSGLLEWGKS